MVRVAKGAVVFAVNETVAVSSLTEQQVCDLYSGQMKSWHGAGGDDHPVMLLTRPPTEVDPEVIRARIACFAALTADLVVFDADPRRDLTVLTHPRLVILRGHIVSR